MTCERHTIIIYCVGGLGGALAYNILLSIHVNYNIFCIYQQHGKGMEAEI